VPRCAAIRFQAEDRCFSRNFGAILAHGKDRTAFTHPAHTLPRAIKISDMVAMGRVVTLR
jgi:hypothetical protein